MRLLLAIVGNAAALYATTVVPGITFTGTWLQLAVAGAIFGVLNLIVRPLALILSIPALILTLGLFYFILNALLLWGFSRLLPGTHIKPHRGFTDVVLRYHIALDVPEGTLFDIGGEERVWKEGESWVFDDTFEHQAMNRGERPRTVLLLDFLRPYALAGNKLKLLLKRLRFKRNQHRSIIFQARELHKQQLAEGNTGELDKGSITPP